MARASATERPGHSPREIAIQRRVPARGLPAPATLRRWADAAAGDASGDLAIVIVTPSESRRLNRTYRHKDKPTNVLSFPAADADAGVKLPDASLGDIVICADVVRREAAQQRKPVRAHWAHMVVHGVLHLLGHDHVREREARAMEDRERRILGALGFGDPYAAEARA